MLLFKLFHAQSTITQTR